MKRSTLIAAFVTSMSAELVAQPVDVPSAINTALQNRGQVRKVRLIPQEVRDCEERCCGHACEADCTRCFWKTIQVEQIYTEPLRAVTTQVVRVHSITFEEPIVNALPAAIRQQTFHTINCTSTQQTASVSLSLNLTKSDSVVLTRTISESTTVGGNISYTYENLGVGLNVAVARSFSIATAESQSRSESYTVTENVNQVVQPRTEMWGALRATESNLSVPFRAHVVIDGTLDSNLDGYAKISDALSESQRTIVLDGVLRITAASDAKKSFYERALVASDCPTSPPATATTSVFEGAAQPLGVTSAVTGPDLAPSAGVFVNSAKTDMLATTLAKLKAKTLSVASGSKQKIAIDRSKLQPGDRLDTPSFSAGGQHQCQSSTDIGHTCNVFEIGFDDCNQAAIKLRMNDCCPTTRVCGPDPQTGEIKCRYGGTSIAFTMNYCVPF